MTQTQGYNAAYGDPNLDQCVDVYLDTAGAPKPALLVGPGTLAARHTFNHLDDPRAVLYIAHRAVTQGFAPIMLGWRKWYPNGDQSLGQDPTLTYPENGGPPYAPVPLDAQTADVAALLTFLRAHAGVFPWTQVDLTRIGILCGSGGGTCALLAMNAMIDAGDATLKSVVGWSPGVGASLTANPTTAAQELYGLDAAHWDTTPGGFIWTRDPLNVVRPTGPPVHVYSAEFETNIPQAVARQYVAALRAAGRTATYGWRAGVDLPGPGSLHAERNVQWWLMPSLQQIRDDMGMQGWARVPGT